MPTPSKNETESEYIQRCVPELIKEGKDQSQAYAICKAKWDTKDFKTSTQKALNTLISKGKE